MSNEPELFEVKDQHLDTLNQIEQRSMELAIQNLKIDHSITVLQKQKEELIFQAAQSGQSAQPVLEEMMKECGKSVMDYKGELINESGKMKLRVTPLDEVGKQKMKTIMEMRQNNSGNKPDIQIVKPV